MPSALSKRMPDGSASSSQEGPFPSFRSYSSAPEASTREKERKKTLRPSSLPSIPSPSSPAVWHASFQPAARQRRGLSPRPEESFFRDGESTRGEGAVFTKNAPSPLVPPTPRLPQHLSPKTTAAPKDRRDEGMTRGRPRPHRGHGRPACYSISSVRIMWRAAAVSSRRRTGIFTGASSSCWGSDLPKATISRRASM